MESFTTNLQPRIEVLAKPADFDDWTGLLALLRESFAYMEGRIDPLSSLHRLDASKLAVKAMEEERSEEHTSELQSLMRNSYAVFCLQKKTKNVQKLKAQQTRNRTTNR